MVKKFLEMTKDIKFKNSKVYILNRINKKEMQNLHTIGI